MTTGRTHEPQAVDLTSMMDAIPKIQAVRPRTGPARWRGVWSTRHTIAVVVLTGVLSMFYGGAAIESARTSGAFAVLGLAAVLGAATLASYLPAKGASWRGSVRLEVCTIVPAVMVLLGVPMILAATEAPLGLVVVLLAFGAARRYLGPEAC